MFHMKHSAFSIRGEKGKKAVKTAKSAMQRDSSRLILRVAKEFRIDLLKRRQREEKKAKPSRKRRDNETTKFLWLWYARTVGEQHFL